MTEPTELEQAQETVNVYRSRQGQAPASFYLAYMRARAVLEAHQRERLTAGQRGFLAATSSPLIGAQA